MSMNYSIIIPHYQEVEFLKKCLKSIPDNREDIEVIVVNDGLQDETDRLSALISSDIKNNLFIFSNEGAMRSAGACRNTGMKYAKGKWLLFLDADDCFSPSAFQIMDRFLDDDADIIFFRCDSVNYPEMTPGRRHELYVRLLEGFIDGKLSEGDLRYRWGSPCSKMIRKELTEKYDIFFDEIRYSNDVMFSVKTGYYAEKIKACNEIVYIITRKENSLTTNKSSDVFKKRFDVYLSKYDYLKDKLDKEEFLHVMGWPYGKLTHAFKLYGFKVASYVYKEFKKRRIGPGGLSLQVLAENSRNKRRYKHEQRYFTKQ